MDQKDVSETLSNDIQYLENQIANLKITENILSKDLNVQHQKRLWYEVKIQELKNIHEFYVKQAENINERITRGKQLLSNFEMAAECYNRLISIQEENLDLQNEFEFDEIDNITPTINTVALSKDIEKYKNNIQQNKEAIKSLVQSITQAEKENLDIKK